jgi:FixJ family two-component response regulator
VTRFERAKAPLKVRMVRDWPGGDLKPAMSLNAQIWIVDDDAGTLSSFADLLESVGYAVRTFDKTAAFVAALSDGECDCAVLDIRIGAENGLYLQRRLADEGVSLPVIFVTGHGDVSMSVQAMKAGAVDFLQKPVREQDLLDAIDEALARGRARQQDSEMARELRERH